jgi:hypothetical protein
MKTTTELADAVLRDIGVVDAEETPDTVDRNYVIEAYELKWAELSAHGLEYTYWPIAEIPDQVFLIVRDLVKMEVVGAFGQSIAPSQKEAEERIILTRLRRHVQKPTSRLAAEALYF